jgi:predicted methyltransferase
MKTRFWIAAAAALALGACGHVSKGAPAEAAYDYSSAFAKDDRAAEDYELYEPRKAKETLAFTGVEPGMTVIDMEAGGGFYTELFSKVVGDTGKVYLQNPKEFDAFLGDAVAKRVGTRLKNVTPVKAPFDTLSFAPTASADLVTWFQGPHELWYTPEGATPGAFGRPEKAFPEIARVLKKGGHFVVLDHSAKVGEPATTGGTIHRIDPAIIIKMAKDAGFKLVDQSDMLANPEDDRTLNVFDPKIRRKTDQFLLKFEKR